MEEAVEKFKNTALLLFPCILDFFHIFLLYSYWAISMVICHHIKVLIIIIL